MNRKMSIQYEGKPVNINMLNDVLKRFNQDLTIKQSRYLINS